jgi:hypothetical protein
LLGSSNFLSARVVLDFEKSLLIAIDLAPFEVLACWMFWTLIAAESSVSGPGITLFNEGAPSPIVAFAALSLIKASPEDRVLISVNTGCGTFGIACSVAPASYAISTNRDESSADSLLKADFCSLFTSRKLVPDSSCLAVSAAVDDSGPWTLVRALS